MSILDAILQGVLQGLTEFLPVSSSGHLSLFQYFTGNSGENGFLFSILLHAGTLVAVCVVFWKTILQLAYETVTMAGDLVTGKLKGKRLNSRRRMVLMLILSILPLFLMLLLKDFVSGFSTDKDITVEGFCFLLTGIMLLIASRKGEGGSKTAVNMTPKNALAVGVAQLIATMPGISRSGSTISTGLLCGFDRSFAVSYSFILGIPAVLGAIVLEVGDAMKEELTIPVAVMIAGLVTSIMFGILAIKFVQWLVKGNKLKYFGIYTLILGTVVIIIGTVDHMTGYSIQQFFAGAA